MFVKGKTVQHSVFPTHNGVLSHAAAFAVTVGFVMYTASEKKENNSSELVKTIVHFIHLFSFSTWVGVQFWIHVSGTKLCPIQLQPFMNYFIYCVVKLCLLSCMRTVALIELLECLCF